MKIGLGLSVTGGGRVAQTISAQNGASNNSGSGGDFTVTSTFADV